MTNEKIEIVNNLQRFVDRARSFLHNEKISPLYLSLCACDKCGNESEGSYRILRDSENGFDPSFIWQYGCLGSESPKQERDWHPISPEQIILGVRDIKIPQLGGYSLAKRIAVSENIPILEVQGRVNHRNSGGEIYRTTSADPALWGRVFVIGGRR